MFGNAAVITTLSRHLFFLLSLLLITFILHHISPAPFLQWFAPPPLNNTVLCGHPSLLLLLLPDLPCSLFFRVPSCSPIILVLPRSPSPALRTLTPLCRLDCFLARRFNRLFRLLFMSFFRILTQFPLTFFNNHKIIKFCQ